MHGGYVLICVTPTARFTAWRFWSCMLKAIHVNPDGHIVDTNSTLFVLSTASISTELECILFRFFYCNMFHDASYFRSLHTVFPKIKRFKKKLSLERISKCYLFYDENFPPQNFKRPVLQAKTKPYGPKTS